jgi:hypothetical protein
VPLQAQPLCVDGQRHDQRSGRDWQIRLVRLVGDVTVGPDGKHYSGTFTLDAYDTSFNQTAHRVGVINGTRITMGTTVNDLM